MEELEDLAARLVHDGDDGHALPGSEAGDSAHDMEGGSTVKAAGGLIQEEKAGTGQDVEADAQSFLLPAADSLARPPADPDVQRASQPHLPHRVVTARQLLRRRHGVRQAAAGFAPSSKWPRAPSALPLARCLESRMPDRSMCA